MLLLAAMLAIGLVVAAPALGQVSGGNNNIIICANRAAQDAQAHLNNSEDAQATLVNLLDQLNRCGVFINDNDTTISNEDTTINNERTTINNEDVTQESDQTAESGNIDATADVGNWGDNAALCVPIMQSNNTGNDQAGQQIAQSNAMADNIEPSGNASELSSELAEECATAPNQATAS